ncbi:MAG: RIP metalloprotease RseP, partial [Nitrospirae bacterium]|nr:RIP metalloprotease RseP [Nitrospirota bacterium]
AMIHTILVFLVVLGFLIFVHELGHFLVARWTGVRVIRFSLGFGPKIYGKTVGDTEYMVSAIPLGGYVKMAGDDPSQELTKSPEEFSSRTLGERTRIVLAGPMMNIIIAFALMPLVFLLGTEMPAFLDEPPVVGWVQDDSPARAAGFAIGDRLESVAGNAVATWEQTVTQFATRPETTVEVVVDRAGERRSLTLAVPAQFDKGTGSLGILPDKPAIVGAVSPGKPAAVAGLKLGDEIVSLNGQPITNWYQMSDAIQKNQGASLTITYRRDGSEAVVELTPAMDEVSKRWMIGVGGKESMVFRRYGVGESIVLGVAKMWDLTRLTFGVLGQLFTGHLSIKALGGPIMIAQVTGEAADSGFSDVVRLVAFISLQLGIMNLLPIPVLDGGWLLFFLIEAVIGHPLNRRGQEIAQTVGFVLLITLAIVVSYNDIMRIIG